MNRNTFNKSVVPGLFAFMVSGYKPKNSESLWRKLCTVRSSKRAYEENAYFSTLGTIPAKPEGTAITYDEFVQGPTKRWTAKTYGLGVKVSEELIEDALYPDIPTKMEQITKELGSSARETQELLVHDLINNYANYTAGDGVVIFNGSHTSLRGGTWSNILSPAADLTATSLQTAIDNFETTKDDSGKYQIIKVRYLIVAPQNAWKAKELLNSTYDPESANNAVNTIKDRNLSLIVSPYLTDTDAWTLMAEPPSSSSGIIAFERRAVTFAKDGDFETGDAKFKATFRFSVAVNRPDNLYHAAGA